MKTLVAAVALATMIASPALAQTTYRQARQAAVGYQPYAQQVWLAPDQAFAQQYWPIRRAYSLNPANDVFDSSGDYLGSDPDPRVRMMLRNDRYEHGDE